MINNYKKFGAYSDIIFDARTKSGKKVKRVAQVLNFIFMIGSVAMWSALICYGIFS